MSVQNRERVVVTGMGVVTPLGQDLTSTWESLVNGVSGAGPITLFDASEFAVRFACEVKDWLPERFIDKKKLKEMDRFTQFAMAAARMAIEDAGLELTEEEEERAGCFIGVGLGGLGALETAKDVLRDRGPSKISPYTILRIIGNLAAGHVSIAHRLRGPSFATTSACATGAHALGEAAEWIRRGKADVMVAGGAEATISPVGIGGFQAMHALSRRNDAPTRASRPFEQDRDGFVCGEGSGVVVLESLTRARKRGARIYAELTGYGASSDAFHPTNPAPEGEGCQRSMKLALADAELDKDCIGYLNAHATSTAAGDRSECQGIVRVFGSHATDRVLAVSSTKSMTGHLLGAAGAVEGVFSVCSIWKGVLPPTINIDVQDPACPLDIVPNEARLRQVDHVMSNGFGFGGTNATLIFSRV
jgi:3-oxoacyl-[acyl-carrier-protein] synthase II